MEIDDGGPAFPRPPGRMSYGDGTSEAFYAQEGMPLRDWFAGQALKGCATSAGYQGLPWDLVAEQCYLAADAMMQARKRT